VNYENHLFLLMGLSKFYVNAQLDVAICRVTVHIMRSIGLMFEISPFITYPSVD